MKSGDYLFFVILFSLHSSIWPVNKYLVFIYIIFILNLFSSVCKIFRFNIYFNISKSLSSTLILFSTSGSKSFENAFVVFYMLVCCSLLSIFKFISVSCVVIKQVSFKRSVVWEIAELYDEQAIGTKHKKEEWERKKKNRNQ